MSYSALPEDYAARALSLCIMQPTVSGGDAGIFRRLHTLLRQLFPRLFSLCSCETLGGGALLLYLPGAPEGQPLVFLSHLDVVSPGDISAWTYPPFGGETHGGYIYGRGAADMKGHLVALLTASEGLLSEGWQPGGDIWLAFSCDEETRGGSMAAMARLLQARGVHPAFILDEGGKHPQLFSLTRKPFATVGVAEKGRLLFSLSCTAPRALEELSRAAARISRIHPRARLCDPVLSDMLPAMRPLMNGRDRFCLSHGRLFHGLLLHRLSRTATGRASHARSYLMEAIGRRAAGRDSHAALFGQHPARGQRRGAAAPGAPLHQARAHHAVRAVHGGARRALPRQRPRLGCAVHRHRRAFSGHGDRALSAGRRHGRAAHGSALPAGIPLQPLHPAADELLRVHGVDERLSLENLNRGVAFFRQMLQA
ncbi:MAG: M20/M25/M40 family metallo-hydrolase [Christensenellales bacterium]